MVKANKVVSISAMQEKQELQKFINKQGVNQKFKSLNSKDTKIVLTRFKKVTQKMDLERELFLEDFKPLLYKWSFEEVFAFTIDLFNSHLLHLCDNQEFELDQIFPALYDEIYTKSIEALCFKYEK